MTDSRSKIVFALFMTTFLAAIEGTIVATAMTAITNDLQGMKYYSWVNSIYLLAMVITTPIYGRLSDAFGRKRLIMIGTVIFFIGSMLSGLAWDMLSLIIFRFIQGIGGAALLSLPMIIITDLYELEQRSKIQGWLASIWGIAGIAGPILGGLLVDYVSWRSIFYLNVPFAALAFYLLAKHMHKDEAGKQLSFDIKGVSLFSISMLLFMFSLNQLSEASLSSWAYVLYSGLILLSIIFFIAFVWHERKDKDPFISFEMFKNKMLMFTIWSGFFISIINIAVLFYIPLWFQGMLGYNATYSGMIMVPLSITWPISSILAGQWAAKFGVKKLIYIGVVFLLLSGVGFALIEPTTAHWLIMLHISIAGLAYGFLFTACTIISGVVAEPRVRGAAMSMVQLFRTLGQTIGLTIWGFFIFSNQADLQYITKLASSIQLVFGFVAILTVLLSIYILYTMLKEQKLEGYGLLGKARTSQFKG